MNTQFKFKTNIKCSGCVAGVTPELNNTEGIINWEVDTESADKILTVNVQSATEEAIEEAVKRAGFKIEKINSER